MNGRNLSSSSSSSLIPNTSTSNVYPPDCGEDAQKWWQSREPFFIPYTAAPSGPSLDRRPILSEADSEQQRVSHPHSICAASPDYPYERGDASIVIPPPLPLPLPAETFTTPRASYSPASNMDGQAPDNWRSGKQPLQSSPPPPPRRPKGQRVVYVQDIVTRLLIMSQLDTR